MARRLACRIALRRSAGLAVLAFFAALPSAVLAQATEVYFERVTDNAGITFMHDYGGVEKAYISEFGGSGAAWLDYDRDGELDLFLVNGLRGSGADPVAASIAGLAGQSSGGGHALFRRRHDRYEPVTGAGGAGDHVWGNGAAVADLDNDGFPDLLVTAIGPDRLYRNNGDGTFSVWPAGVEDAGWGASASFVDWDGDGWVDLYVAKYVDFDGTNTPTVGDRYCMYQGIDVFCGPEGLDGARDVFFRNRADGTFEPWPTQRIDRESTYGLALVATDCNGDARPEIYVANDSTINLLYLRDDAGVLDEWGLFSGAGYSSEGLEQAGMGATAADFDADGHFDLLVSNFQNDNNALYRNLGNCAFEEVSQVRGLAASSLPYMGWAAQFFDADGDADLDVFVANGHIYPQLDEYEPYAQRNLLSLNRLRETGEARFEELGQAAGPGLEIEASSRAAVIGDYDNDLDADVLVTNINGAPDLLRNDSEPRLPALQVRLVGRAANRMGYGARVLVRSGEDVQVLQRSSGDGYLGSNDVRLLIYLPSGRADELRVQWGAGEETILTDVTPGRIVVDQARGVVARRN